MGSSIVLDKPNDLIEGCWWLWRGIVINWDEGISPCCTISDKSTDFGVFNNNIGAIWNSHCYQSARKLFSKYKIESKTKTICHSCGVIDKNR